MNQPIYPEQAPALSRDLADIHLGGIGGAERVALDTAGRRVSGERGTRVTICWHRHALDAKGLGHGDRHTEPAGLEAARGESAFIFYNHLSGETRYWARPLAACRPHPAPLRLHRA